MIGAKICITGLVIAMVSLFLYVGFDLKNHPRAGVLASAVFLVSGLAACVGLLIYVWSWA